MVSENANAAQLRFTAAGLAAGQTGRANAPFLLSVGIVSATGVELVEFMRDGDIVHSLNPRGTQRLSRQLLRVAWTAAPEGFGEGYVELLNNEIREATPYGRPAPELRTLGPRRIAWSAEGHGSPQGVVLRLRSSHQGILQFVSPTLRFTRPLHQFAGRRALVEGRVELCWLSDIPAPRELQVSWSDSPAPGRHEYRARVTEADGGLLMSAPVSITVVA